MEIIKFFVYALEGKKNCEIFREKDVSNFDLIKDQITIYEFIDKNDYENFLRKTDEELDVNHVLLTKEEMEYIMDNSPSNKEALKNNTNVTSAL
ncbi:MAG TPA: hypothetical protein PLS85_10805 [Chitinophagales bacterium]|nr:hypothetical protein [Chitinophagales bacterium]